MKTKISVTVDSKTVEWIDSQVKTQRFRNRSHAVEIALMRFIEKEKG
jgi:Arc/MetJ-type ribon-helix-helix transcriptional regulator